MLTTCLRSCQLARLFDPPGLEARLNVPPQCLDLDKFVAVPTEDRLVSRALELLANGTFWAGIVFDNLGSNASDVPPYVKYKIRMDIDEVEGTKKLKDRYVLLAPVPLWGGLSICRWAEPGCRKLPNCCVSMSAKDHSLSN